MRKIVFLIGVVLGFLSCNSNSVEKPDNLIGRDKMVDILYDISLIEAIKNQNINGGLSAKVGNEYIYKKYKIDSLQFVKSNKYYASNIDDYKKMFEEVKAKLTNETSKIEGQMNKNGQQVPPTSPVPTNENTPQVQ